jgi:hypothetical protein
VILIVSILQIIEKTAAVTSVVLQLLKPFFSALYGLVYYQYYCGLVWGDQLLI